MKKAKAASKSLEEARKRQEKTLKHISMLERKVPWVAKVTQHPRFKHWVPPVFAALEVGASLFAIFVVLPWLISLLPDFNIKLPRIPFPDLPDINLPSIPLPDITLPTWDLNLPGWLETILYWLRKTTPVWIALGFAVYEARRRNKKDDTSPTKKTDKK